MPGWLAGVHLEKGVWELTHHHGQRTHLAGENEEKQGLIQQEDVPVVECRPLTVERSTGETLFESKLCQVTYTIYYLCFGQSTSLTHDPVSQGNSLDLSELQCPHTKNHGNDTVA